MAETGGMPPGEMGGWIAAILAVIGGPAAVAKAVRWMSEHSSARRESRAAGNREWEAKLAAREAEQDQRMADSLRKCEEHCAAVTLRADKMFYVIGLMLPEVQRLAPESPLLRRAIPLLAEILPIPIDPELPADMKATLARIDAATA